LPAVKPRNPPPPLPPPMSCGVLGQVGYLVSLSRTFGHEITSLEELQEAVSVHIARAAEKFSHQGSVCGHIQVFIALNPFKGDRKYTNANNIDLTPPTAYTPCLIEVGGELLKRIYQSGLLYKKKAKILPLFNSFLTIYRSLYLH